MKRIFIVCMAIGFFASLTITSTSQALPFEGHRIVMSVANRYAALAGQEIAEQGGNVVDSAVAMVLVMSVTDPNFGALGGGGFALVKMKRHVQALDFRETATAAMGPSYYLKKGRNSITGGASVGVPGVVAGLWALHKKYGHMPWRKLFTRAMQLAHNGFRLSDQVSSALDTNYQRFNKNARALFLKNGKPYLPGSRIVQRGYWQALRQIRDRGPSAFYTGSIARDIVQAVHSTGGDMSLNDLKKYHVVWRKPLKTQYHGYTVYVMPLPSSGGLITIRALHLLNMSGIDKTPLLSVDEFHLLGQVLERAFMDRTDMGDPAYFKMNDAKLLSSARLRKLARSIRMKHAMTSKQLAAFMAMPFPKTKHGEPEARETTHLSILDSKGNAVSMTYTLNGNFGSGVATKKYGIMLNDEMDDFTTHPGKPNMFGLVQGKGNDVQAGKRPLSSMSPTLVAKNGKVMMAIGAPGGPRIISSVIEVLYRVLGRHEDLERAVAAPRVHHQFLPDILYYDNDQRMSYEDVQGLKARWPKVKAGWQAHIFAVMNVKGILQGVVDTRGEGSAAGF